MNAPDPDHEGSSAALPESAALRRAEVENALRSGDSSALSPGSLVDVAVPLPLRRSFTYRLPAQTSYPVVRGSRVAVPFRRRVLAGFVLGESTAPPPQKLAEVLEILDPEPIFSDELFRFLLQAARYYAHPLGEVLQAASPALDRDELRRLRRRGAESAALASRRSVRPTRVTFVRRLRFDDLPARFGDKQRSLLAALTDSEEQRVDELRHLVASPLATLRRLAETGWVELSEREVLDLPGDGGPEEQVSTAAPNLTLHQRVAVDAITEAIAAHRYRGMLLHGITGAGKTEVYLRCIEEARRAGRSSLILVPEIALTPQLVGRFRARLGDSIAVLHSGLSEKQRFQTWRSLHQGETRIAVGARSALFAPLQDLGLIVVDEEHDPSFKQEEGFRYQARDMALLRATLAQAVCVLGSATPSLESYHLAQEKRLDLIQLPERATPHPLPQVEIVDLAKHRLGPSGNPYLSAPLHRALEHCLEEGQQAILFLNRRGFAPSVRCLGCGKLVMCPDCSVTLTEHRHAHELRCHYCGFAKGLREAGTHCPGAPVEGLGLGTEQLEEVLRASFPGARVARLDRDTAASGVRALLDDLRQGKLDILVGTQMVTKGHDMPGVTLVGVVLADLSLALPDFRAAERTFQLLTQVAGRAGRGEKEGRVLIQTFQPDHPALVFAREHDFEGFYRAEMHDRKELLYPPCAHLVAFRIEASELAAAKEAAHALASHLRSRGAGDESLLTITGPAPAPILRLRTRYRYRVFVRSPERAALRRTIQHARTLIDQGLGSVRVMIDVDPVSMV